MKEQSSHPEPRRPTASIEINGQKKEVEFGIPRTDAGMTSGKGAALHESRNHEEVDPVEEGSQESFPASDPPSYTP